MSAGREYCIDDRVWCTQRPALAFDESANCWLPLSESPLPDDDGEATFSLLTFNVWFDDYARVTRNNEVLAIVRELRPTVACLQEVLKDLLALLMGDSWLRANYLLSSGRMSGYGCLLLLRRDACRDVTLTRSALTSRMQRDLLTASFRLDGRQVLVSTCHFESLSQRQTRATQLDEYRLVAEHLQRRRPAELQVLCGDFNFCSYRQWSDADTSPLENDVLAELLPHLVDVWPLLHGRLPPRLHPPDDDAERARMGYTYDTDRNPNIGHKKPECMRYDRILCTDSSGGLKPTSVRLVGCTPCRQKFPEPPPRFRFTGSLAVVDTASEPVGDVLPSDHFGVFAEFSL